MKRFFSRIFNFLFYTHSRAIDIIIALFWQAITALFFAALLYVSLKQTESDWRITSMLLTLLIASLYSFHIILQRFKEKPAGKWTLRAEEGEENRILSESVRPDVFDYKPGWRNDEPKKQPRARRKKK